MTKVQMEQRIKELEDENASLKVKLETANRLTGEVLKDYDGQELKIKNLKAVLKDLLVNEQEGEVSL